MNHEVNVPESNSTPDFEERMNDYRHVLGQIETQLRKHVKTPDIMPVSDPDHYDEGEVKANMMIAVRYLEDARMRLGKAIQYHHDGVSILDKHDIKHNG